MGQQRPYAHLRGLGGWRGRRRAYSPGQPQGLLGPQGLWAGVRRVKHRTRARPSYSGVWQPQWSSRLLKASHVSELFPRSAAGGSMPGVQGEPYPGQLPTPGVCPRPALAQLQYWPFPSTLSGHGGGWGPSSQGGRRREGQPFIIRPLQCATCPWPPTGSALQAWQIPKLCLASARSWHPRGRLYSWSRWLQGPGDGSRLLAGPGGHSCGPYGG